MPTSQTQPTQAELKRAYTMVSQDLTQALLKAPVNTPIRFGKLGSFKKTEHQMTSHLAGKSYTALKQELNQALERKYNR